jgi:hypothetical protein
LSIPKRGAGDGAGWGAAQLAATIIVHVLIEGWKALVSEMKRLRPKPPSAQSKIIVTAPVC